jgi:hypothetical protein
MRRKSRQKSSRRRPGLKKPRKRISSKLASRVSTKKRQSKAQLSNYFREAILNDGTNRRVLIVNVLPNEPIPQGFIKGKFENGKEFVRPHAGKQSVFNFKPNQLVMYGARIHKLVETAGGVKVWKPLSEAEPIQFSLKM